MALKHHNPTQKVSPPKFAPLLKDEGTFYTNLNRSVESAYKYIDSINNMYTYGGNVSRIKNSGTDIPDLYDIVRILDNETFTIDLSGSHPEYYRFGIVLAEDSDGYYLICTFNPNLVLPPEYMTFAEDTISNDIYVDTLNNCLTLSTSETSSCIVGRVTGRFSIFFFGTAPFLTHLTTLPIN